MTGDTERPLQAQGWYIIARDGDLVLRIRPGLHLGADPTGEISFEPADAQLEFDICAEGALILRAVSDRALETTLGDRTGSVILDRETPVVVRLNEQSVLLSTDFDHATPPADAMQVRSVPLTPDADTQTLAAEQAPAIAPEQNGSATSALYPRRRQFPARAVALAGASLVLLITAILLLVRDPAPAVAPVIDPVVDRGAESEPKRSNPEALAAAERRLADDADRAVPDATVPAVLPSTAPPEIAAALDGIAALLANEPSPGEAALGVAAQSLEVLEAAYPDNPRIGRLLEQLSDRITAEEARRADGGASAAKIADAAGAQQQPPGLAIEPVSVPPILRRELPDPPQQLAAAAAPETLPADAPVPGDDAPAAQAPDTAGSVESRPLTEFAVLSAGNAASIPGPASSASEWNLWAAARALESGRLMPPANDDAFTLYSRALEADPDSPVARIGLQSVRERLLGQARVALATDDVGAALGLLDDAEKAGADQDAIAPLRSEAVYRQGLLDAIAGKPGRLYPISELTALHQEPPMYPRHAPAGAEGSVDIVMTVTESGTVRDVDVVGDPPMYFVRAARQGVSAWRFAPVVSDGAPVAVRTSVRVTFRRE